MGKRKIYTLIKIIIAFAFIIFLFLALGAVIIYNSESGSRLFRLASKLPYPAVLVDKKDIITISEVKNGLYSVKNFYENQDFSESGLRVDFTTAEGKKRLMILERKVLNKLTENAAIEILAKKRGINVTDDEISQSVEDRALEAGNIDDLKANLRKLYGWTIDDFKERVVRPGLYAKKLEEKIMEEKKSEFNEESLKTIREAENALKSENFADVAKKYSRGQSASLGGEVGWFFKDQLNDDVANQVQSLKIGDRSGIIESEIGYHIVQLEDKKIVDGKETVKIRQIFVNKKTFDEWLTDEMKSMQIYVPLKNYKWDKESAEIVFTDENMSNYEKTTRELNIGDASLLY